MHICTRGSDGQLHLSFVFRRIFSTTVSTVSQKAILIRSAGNAQEIEASQTAHRKIPVHIVIRWINLRGNVFWTLEVSAGVARPVI